MTLRSCATQPEVYKEPSARSVLPALTSEVCERLREMEEAKRHSSTKLLGSLFRLSCDSIAAYNLVLSIVCDQGDALATYQTTAQARGVSRQAVHQDMPHQIEIIRLHFPEIADHIEKLRHAAHANYQGHA